MPAETAETFSSQATARVFFALWPTDAVADALETAAQDVVRQCGGRAMWGDTLHLTLAFLGNVPSHRLAALCEIAQSLEAHALDFTVDRLGYWPHKRLVWAGCQTPGIRLLELQRDLLHRLQEADFSISDAERDFMPHITLVRKIPGSLQLPAQWALSNPCHWVGEAFLLVRSELSPTGARYAEIARFPLGSRA